MADTQLAHMVFFELKDSTPANREKLVADCYQYLDKHDGVVYFSAGTLNPDLARPVNDRAFDVALHVVFASKAVHDVYQSHPRHLQFVAENRESWKHVRVFDSDVAGR